MTPRDGPESSVAPPKGACSLCHLEESCLLAGLSAGGDSRLEHAVAASRRVFHNRNLYRAGDKFESLFALRAGFMKSTVRTLDGREQIMRFHMAGDLIGLDGISSGAHTCEVTAMEDSQVCVIPYAGLAELFRTSPTLHRKFQEVLSREIVRAQHVMHMLGSAYASERIALFLLDISQRLKARQHSASEFLLGMKRAEIGSYLGLELETVSRVLSRFARTGLIDVHQKHVRIVDAAGLRAIAALEGAAGSDSFG